MKGQLRNVGRAGSRLCAACRDRGVCSYGIGHLLFDDQAQTLRVATRCPIEHRGGPAVAHGGWVCAVMDETLGELAQEYFGSVVTANLNVAFLKPTPVEEPLIATSRLVSRDGRKINLTGELHLERTGVTLASARGLFFCIGDDHHDRHAEWLRQQKEACA